MASETSVGPAGMVFCTCACGYQTPWADPETADEMMRRHRIGCTAVTQRA